MFLTFLSTVTRLAIPVCLLHTESSQENPCLMMFLRYMVKIVCKMFIHCGTAPDTCFKGSWCQFPTQQEFRTLENQSRRRSSEYLGMENMGNAFSQEFHRDPVNSFDLVKIKQSQ